MLTRSNGDGRDPDPAPAAWLTQRLHPRTVGAAEHAAIATAESRGDAASRVGSFWFWFTDERWKWSDEVFRMHGYEPGSVVPTTQLTLSHTHPDDRQAVQDLLHQARYGGGSFFSRHRLCDTAGNEHSVLVFADRILDDTGAIVGTRGYYVDVTEALEESRRDVLQEALPKVIEARAEIEQAKGALRVIYGISSEQAFTVLRWRSQETNTKLRALAAQLMTELESLTTDAGSLQAQFDHLILSVHERVPANHDSR